MMMEIKLSEEKCIENGYDINKCYKVLDDNFISNGMKKIGQGVYHGTNFGKMGIAQIRLSECDWFMRIVEEWYVRFSSDNIEDREDCLEAYKKYGHLLSK